MKYIGIDWGEKRIGLAFADEIGIALPLKAAVSTSKKKRMQHIEDTIEQQNAQVLIVGYPINMDGTIGPKAKEVDLFIEELIKRFNLPVERVDERLSSHAVLQGYKEKKAKSKRKSGEIDSRAAALILQDFLEAQLFKTNSKIVK